VLVRFISLGVYGSPTSRKLSVSLCVHCAASLCSPRQLVPLTTPFPYTTTSPLHTGHQPRPMPSSWPRAFIQLTSTQSLTSWPHPTHEQQKTNDSAAFFSFPPSHLTFMLTKASPGNDGNLLSMPLVYKCLFQLEESAPDRHAITCSDRPQMSCISDTVSTGSGPPGSTARLLVHRDLCCLSIGLLPPP
jgi:hypothetical protein